ncbi:MAG TPA: T9SS type A sorting domain-containing protein, partial [Bacteroidota bacterium]|nr:T9SS type A sorting domain-containing protein [Bacteroidota bacterium]
YRVVDSRTGGGAGAFYGYTVPLAFSDSNASPIILSRALKSLRIKVSSAIDSGSISATLDWDGKLSQFSIDGDFALLGSVVVHSDSVNGFAHPVSFGDVDTLVTSVQTGKGGNLPKTFALYQNYPNPFNPSTIIRYDLPQDAMVTVRIYNVLGQHVKTLINERQSAGEKTAEFNALLLPSGVYFYSIRAGSFSDTKKMIIIR